MSDLKIQRHDRVVTVRLPGLHVPSKLNRELLAEVLDALRPLDADPDVGCFVIVQQKLAAADADVKRMAEETATAPAVGACSSSWEEFARLPTPKIAAVDGYALGDGYELAMLCDIIIAGESAVFGQPEIKLGGVIPGAGGATQRLPRLVGRAKAMDMILAGRTMGAWEAERCGLVSRVVADGQVLAEAAHVATTIAALGDTAITAARAYVDQALETDSREAVLFERRVFHALFPQGRQQWARKIPQQRPPHFGS